MLDLFRDWDEDGNGEVSKKEFRNAMPKLGLDLPKKVIDEVFESYDLDGSGVMEFEELKKMLKPPPSAATKKLWGKATDAAIADGNAQKGAGSLQGVCAKGLGSKEVRASPVGRDKSAKGANGQRAYNAMGHFLTVGYYTPASGCCAS